VREQDDKEQRLTRHQFYVLRLQRQLASGLADALSQRLADDLDLLRSGITRALQQRWRLIPGAVNVPAMFPPSDADARDGTGRQQGGSPVLDFVTRWEHRNGA
jgi:hypothetical protein